jgi:hypothetical protein
MAWIPLSDAFLYARRDNRDQEQKLVIAINRIASQVSTISEYIIISLSFDLYTPNASWMITRFSAGIETRQVHAVGFKRMFTSNQAITVKVTAAAGPCSRFLLLFPSVSVYCCFLGLPQIAALHERTCRNYSLL